MGLEPVDPFFVSLLRARQFMGLDLIMQHELQRGAGDFVIIDDKHPPLVDGFRCLDANLHCYLLSPDPGLSRDPEAVAISVPRGAGRLRLHTKAQGRGGFSRARGIALLSDFEQSAEQPVRSCQLRYTREFQQVSALCCKIISLTVWHAGC